MTQLGCNTLPTSSGYKQHIVRMGYGISMQRHTVHVHLGGRLMVLISTLNPWLRQTGDIIT